MIEPASGRLASGAQGQGRLPETPVLLDVIRETLGRNGPLRGRVLVVSAGGTREYMDPVRFIGNPASGRQGVELARAAIERGATTRLVLGSATVSRRPARKRCGSNPRRRCWTHCERPCGGATR